MWSNPTLAFLGGTRPLRLSGGIARGAVGSGWDNANVNIPLMVWSYDNHMTINNKFIHLTENVVCNLNVLHC